MTRSGESGGLRTGIGGKLDVEGKKEGFQIVRKCGLMDSDQLASPERQWFSTCSGNTPEVEPRPQF